MTIADEAAHLMNKQLDALNCMIDPVSRGVPRMNPYQVRMPMTAREVLSAAERGVFDVPTTELLLEDLRKDYMMQMQEGALITKPIPWYVIIWEEGTVLLEITVITPCRDRAILMAGFELAELLDTGALTTNLEVSCRPAV